MSKEVKVIVLVLAGLVGLAVLGIVGVMALAFVTIQHSVKGDQASNARTAAKIADFRMPAGYRIEMAMDMMVSNIVIIMPVKRSGGFAISLEGVSVPMQQGDDPTQTMLKTVGSAAECQTSTNAGTDTVKTARGATVTLHVLDCHGITGLEQTVEIGEIPSKYPLGILSARGAPASFDRNALHALVASLR